jgi:glutamate dehydrogenase/leucine dehydrogenase
VNAGGIINISEELRGYSRERAETGLRHIYDATLAVFARAEAEDITTAAAADRQAEARIDAVGRLNLIRPPSR